MVPAGRRRRGTCRMPRREGGGRAAWRAGAGGASDLLDAPLGHARRDGREDARDGVLLGGEHVEGHREADEGREAEREDEVDGIEQPQQQRDEEERRRGAVLAGALPRRPQAVGREVAEEGRQLRGGGRGAVPHGAGGGGEGGGKAAAAPLGAALRRRAPPPARSGRAAALRASRRGRSGQRRGLLQRRGLPRGGGGAGRARLPRAGRASAGRNLASPSHSVRRRELLLTAAGAARRLASPQTPRPAPRWCYGPTRAAAARGSRLEERSDSAQRRLRDGSERRPSRGTRAAPILEPPRERRDATLPARQVGWRRTAPSPDQRGSAYGTCLGLCHGHVSRQSTGSAEARSSESVAMPE